MKRFVALSIINLLIPALSFAALPKVETSSTLAQAEAATISYDSIFPYYTIQCSFSKFRKFDGNESSVAGHTLIYIKGACRDKSFPYPKLKMCDPGTDLSNQASGVALSAEKIVSNSEYVVTDGIDFLLNGAVSPDQPLNTEGDRKTIDAVLASGSMNGLKIHDAYMAKKLPDMSVAEYIAWTGLGTDFGVAFGRDSTCARIPMSESQVKAEVDYINETNEPFVTGAKTFSWSAVGDNCAHFTHDVLAAAGIRTEIPRSNNIARVIYNFMSLHWEIPTNDVLKDMEFTNDLSKIKTAAEVFKDRDSRDLFNRLGTLPRLGAVLEEIPMHLTKNSLYKSNSPDTFLLDIPLVKNRKRKLEAMKNDPIYTNVAANLQNVLTRLKEIQDKSKSAAPATPEAAFSPSPAPSASASEASVEVAAVAVEPAVNAASPSPSPSVEVNGSDLEDFTRRYNAWIDQSILDIEAKLAKITELKLE